MKIIAAAIKVKGTIYSAGTIHACIWCDLFKDGIMPKRSESAMAHADWELVWFEWETEEGFLTDTGEFLNREQAAELALANGQADSCYRPNELHFPDVYIP